MPFRRAPHAPTTRSRRARGVAIAAAGLLCSAALPVPAQAPGQAKPPAQAPGQAPPPTTQAPGQPPPPAQGSGEKAAPKLSPDQLDALVAPIALYPDPLLSQALMASTYPLEIIQAQQWVAKNASLKGDALEKAVQAQPWEPAVQATALIPDLLKRLAEDITWTTNLGNAFLAQQQDVMDSVQRLRTKAKDGGKLESNDKMKVETKVVESKTVVEIQPASTQVVYVPAYNPTVVWGPPVYAYPPVYYPPPPPPGAMLFTFGMGMAMGAAMHGGYCCGCSWGHSNTVVINNNNNFVNNRNVSNNVRPGGANSNWQHNPQHRGGTPYGDRNTAAQYGGGARGGTGQQRGGTSASTMDRGGPGASSPGRGAAPGTSDMSRGGGPGASDMGRGAGPSTSDMSRGAGGSDIGNRSVSAPSGGSAFGGAGGGAGRAQASSSRGASSMGGMGGGGMRGGGGGGRRR